ncbi:alpha/beta fold hydrolase [Ureibacillus sp. MALMAid1270]|uniref:alpha/beta fold hydrolase n=1 Tax=Ureibacillus sp. MALMAid1270 TaxID=3411629 RepID=UPI003BA6EF3F
MMEFLEFGNIRNPKIMLIHGMATTWETCYKATINELKEDFFIIVPVLDGHNPNEQSEFCSIHEVVKKIEQYIVERHGGKLHAASGFSMGGTILIQILANQIVQINRVVLDAAYCAPLGIFSKLCTKFLSTQISKVKENKPFHILLRKVMEYGRFDEDAFRRAFYSSISYNTILNCFSQLFEYRLPKNLCSIKADVTYWYGSNESYAAKSARNLKKVLPNLRIRSFDRYGHGELITKYPKHCVAELKRIIL